MRVEYTLSERDFLEAQKAHSGRPSRLLLVFGSLLMLAGFVTFLQDQKHIGNAFAALFIGAVLAFGRRLLLSYSYRQDKRLHDRFVATVSDDGIEVSASTGDSKNKWEAFTRYVESKNLFVLYQGPTRLSIFPKSAFASGEDDAFRVLVQQKLGSGDQMSPKGLRPTMWIFVVVVAAAFILMLIVIRNAMRQSGPSARPGTILLMREGALLG
jgi:YcxB-like protein